MYIKDLIKELKKYPSDYCVRVRIDNSFWKQEYFGVYDKKEKKYTYDLWCGEKYKGIYIPKKVLNAIQDSLSTPNYWIEHIENTSVDCGKEITLWGEY